jgi:hypothetical protein
MVNPNHQKVLATFYVTLGCIDFSQDAFNHNGFNRMYNLLIT